MSSSLHLFRLKLPDPQDAQALAAAVDRLEDDAERTLVLDDYVAIHFLLSAEPPIPKHETLRRGISWDDDSLETTAKAS